ncbi:hypothetical protein ABE41_020300 [Fictibacillus arsenicus]|uniref:Uncharacterized protein n=1 Tax=Fictibacillus arsenicus TaxID=255247 RepID=A0A1B1ZA94_9BACL|nr:hypothetical protein ABE41_020300 [Fictibacillus arsenicus]
MLPFRGACGEPSWRFAPLEVSPVPLIPQESRTFRSNQLINEVSLKNNSKAFNQNKIVKNGGKAVAFSLFYALF